MSCRRPITVSYLGSYDSFVVRRASRHVVLIIALSANKSEHFGLIVLVYFSRSRVRAVSVRDILRFCPVDPIVVQH